MTSPSPYSLYFTSSSDSTKTSKSIQSITCRDPVQFFPPEIIYQIFAHLPFSSRWSCVLVSKAWQHCITTFPSLWSHVIITEPRHSSSSLSTMSEQSLRTMLTSCLQRSKGALRTLVVDSPKVLTDTVLTTLLRHFTLHGLSSTWTSFKILGAPKLSTSMLTHFFKTLGNIAYKTNTSNQLSTMSTIFKRKKKTEMNGSILGLTHLTFRNVPSLSNEHIASIFTIFPMLKILDVSGCTQINLNNLNSMCFTLNTLVLTYTSLTDEGLLHCVRNFSNLMHLSIAFTSNVTVIGFEKVSQLRSLRSLTFGPLSKNRTLGLTLDNVLAEWDLPMQAWRMYTEPQCHQSLITVLEQSQTCLTHLHLSGCAHVDTLSLQMISQCTQLVSLDVSACPHMTDTLLQSILRHCDQLVMLNISHLHPPHFSGTCFKDVLQYTPRLEKLIAQHVTSLSSSFMLSFVTQHPTWNYLDISGCPRILGDALLQARQYLREYRASATLIYTSGNSKKRGKRVYQ
ncbi:hypothetical protein HMI54_000576 [Coelomomyces lativittatus]|nr:hypothetical protein HMI55_004352 [Coelomomyces lativittatus]KAJ1515289.1 hypothetical protein HMI56_005961 [Coelomomyces lativittatus]KAJ1518460.1 hypothetical protein HMI54_000576 [Coelomomyces lativittatus]